MPYSELIKNFSKIRAYMQEFFVCGFRRRDEFTSKSARSYDDEKRRIEGWLGDYMGFHQTASGKSVFLSMDPRLTARNPLYQAFRSRSFTDGDITLHFILLDLLKSNPGMTVKEISAGIDACLAGFDAPMMFDESTVRKKLNEYAREGVLTVSKSGRRVTYAIAEQVNLACADDALAFFPEVSPCGVIGSYIAPAEDNPPIRFKHHYITHAMDSEVLCALLDAISGHRDVSFTTTSRVPEGSYSNRVLPLKIFVSVQSGRQHLLAYDLDSAKIRAYRIDKISDVKAGDVNGNFDALRHHLTRMQKSMWGVSVKYSARLQHLEFTVRADEDEDYIVSRLYREKRCGTVEQLDATHYRFSCDVYDAGELIPWVRTFLCRITDFRCSLRSLEKQFFDDTEEMFKLYNIGEEGEDE
ncbi:MAG: WYL domain-containing protein [Clostridia bacterium]|nr:WYL domain-containing protein [Clostridia bacterium]